MRIGLVLAKEPGYSETFFKSKIEGLVQRGHEVFLFINNKKTKKDFSGATIVQSYTFKSWKILEPIKVLWVLFKLFFLRYNTFIRYYKLCKQDSMSVMQTLISIYINAHMLNYNLDWLHFGFATIAVRRENVAKAIGAKMAISLRGFDIAIHPLFHPGCYNMVWEKLDKLHVISNCLLRKAMLNGLPDNIPIAKITPAINTSVFINPDKSFNFGNKINILSIGRLHWKKGFIYSIESISRLVKKGYDINYTIIGSGEKERERLIFVAYQFGVLDRINFLGVISHSEIAEELRKANIYLQPSVQEGFCNAVLEAQASKCLCVVSDAEGLPENVLDNVTGFVFHRRRVDEMTNCILKIINMSEKQRSEMANKAANRVIEEFDISKQVNQFIDFYEN